MSHRLSLAAQLRQRRRHVQVRGRTAEDGDDGAGGGGGSGRADRGGLAPPAADAERPAPPAAAAHGPVRAGKTRPRTFMETSKQFEAHE